jgi:hypothetical protein
VLVVCVEANRLLFCSEVVINVHRSFEGIQQKDCWDMSRRNAFSFHQQGDDIVCCWRSCLHSLIVRPRVRSWGLQLSCGIVDVEEGCFTSIVEN